MARIQINWKLIVIGSSIESDQEENRRKGGLGVIQKFREQDEESKGLEKND